MSELSLQAGCAATLSGFTSARDMGFRLKDGATLKGKIEADNITLTLSAGGLAHLEGRARCLVVDAAAGAAIDLSQLIVNAASLTARAGVAIKVNVRSSLDYDLMGGASLIYSGDPIIGKAQAIGAAAVRK